MQRPGLGVESVRKAYSCFPTSKRSTLTQWKKTTCPALLNLLYGLDSTSCPHWPCQPAGSNQVWLHATPGGELSSREARQAPFPLSQQPSGNGENRWAWVQEDWWASDSREREGEGHAVALTGMWGRSTRPLTWTLSCISRRCCLRILYGGIPSLLRRKRQPGVSAHRTAL